MYYSSKAGQGTRMVSNKPKILHQILGKHLVEYPIDVVQKSGAEKICLIVGHMAEDVKKTIGEGVEYRLQSEQLGTGHAVMQAIDFLSDDEEVIILCGDTPLISYESIDKLKSFHLTHNHDVSVLSAIVENPFGYGRIIRNSDENFLRIVEEKDANIKEKQICEINSGIYMFKSNSLKYALSKLTNNNVQKEYYLTDTIEILFKDGYSIGATSAVNVDDILGVNSREQLAMATNIMKDRINKKHMKQGVTLIDPISTYIEPDVVIGQDTIIEPNCIIKGNTEIGSNCCIGYNTKIDNSNIKDNVNIEISVILKSTIGSGTKVGPFAYVRPNSIIGKNVKIGDFVEIKNSTIDDGSKASHLTYIGDADVGKNVNFGCGTVVVNYDGKKKHRSTICDNAFIGCNTNLVSPVVVNENAYIAAGSTITKEVPQDSLAIARQKQKNIENWSNRKR
ncbi:UDP-N-acetylglucosamine diphosphorylase/glucosamine-1-phosphate N-acetyltransferase [Candidatus Epulonipiscium fishelsonii]|nr:UDP-N-acetylglucosamine diphosphorylase/glucosamine-1-phosphate N-acetyltransferase [Epulopiscium sp. SCG-C06WGA-EpuloA1]